MVLGAIGEAKNGFVHEQLAEEVSPAAEMLRLRLSRTEMAKVWKPGSYFFSDPKPIGGN
jgi:hypothetical protein